MPEAEHDPKVRFDGVYQLISGPNTYCLRFKANGTVESTTLRGTSLSADTVVSSLDARLPEAKDEGHFSLSGGRLKFSCTSPYGTVDYEGRIGTSEELVLDSYSHINGNRASGEIYRFAVITGSRKLYEMVPRCLKLDCGKIKYGTTYEHGCGIRVTDGGWPLPARDEKSIGRWNVMGSRLFIDAKDDPAGPYVRDGSLGLLVTDRSIRGSFYEGNGPVGKLSIRRHVLTFYWPYQLMNQPTISFYEDDRRLHLIIEDPDKDGHLGLQGVTRPKSAKVDDFLSPVLSVKNRIEELAAQLDAARSDFESTH
jgi:hypothetical protein